MPFIIVLIGILLVAIGYQGTHKEFMTLLKGDFSGPNNFVFWFIALFSIGLVGYAPKLKGFSDAFMVLVIIVLFLSNDGFFDKFVKEIESLQNPSTGEIKI